MGKYHNPAAEVPEIGRRILTGGWPTLEGLQGQVHPGESLLGLTNNGLFSSAPLMRSQADVDEFYGQYATGRLLSLSFYAVPTDKIKIG